MSEIKENERYLRILEQLGKAYLARGEFAAAYEKLAQLIAAEPENAAALKDAALAAAGLADRSDAAMALYEKAVAANPDSRELLLRLAEFFVSGKTAGDFALRVIHEALKYSPQNETNLRMYLKTQYEKHGDLDKAREQEETLAFASNDALEVRSYFESIWWKGDFEQAWRLLEKAEQQNGTHPINEENRILTNAYQLYYAGERASNKPTIQVLAKHLQHLNPARSMVELQHYLLLLSLLPDDHHVSLQQEQQADEYLIFLDERPLDELFTTFEPEATDAAATNAAATATAFDIQRQVLDRLQNPLGNDQLDPKTIQSARSYLFLQIIPAPQAPALQAAKSQIIEALKALPDTLTRQSGMGFVNIAADAEAQFACAVELLERLEQASAGMPADKGFKIAAAQEIVSGKAGDGRAVLENMLEGIYLLRLAKIALRERRTGGEFFVHAGPSPLKKLDKKYGPFIWSENADLLPGKSIKHAEVLWQNPLAGLRAGQPYLLRSVALNKLLQKHVAYLTVMGRNEQLERPVVARILSPQKSHEILNKDAEKQRIYDTLRKIGQLSHPNIARLYDMGEHDRMIFLVREYIEGQNLAELAIEENARESETLLILQNIIRALMAAAREGVMHLNLKPSNVWMNDAGEIKLTDFACPGFAPDFATAEVLFPAQWRYTSPELLAGGDGASVSERSDIYSLGVIAFELLSGTHPYTRTSGIKSPEDLRKARLEPLPQKSLAHHEAWNALIMKALQHDPDKRWASLAEFETELRKIQFLSLQAKQAELEAEGQSGD